MIFFNIPSVGQLKPETLFGSDDHFGFIETLLGEEYIRNEIKEHEYLNIIKDLENIHSNITLILNNKKIIEELAVDFIDIKGSMFLGRGLSYPIALEGALKFKELTYLHAEGYPAGEMKHGPLALVENGMPVIVIAPKDRFYEKTISNMQEVIARGGKILLISDHAEEVATSENIWSEIRIPKIHKFLSPFLSNIPLQLLAYYVALKKGHDIDKPRNLAKSVTVE
jgi:glucosamine--fructose-6-phosphate aminotransferase (isomerizing)